MAAKSSGWWVGTKRRGLCSPGALLLCTPGACGSTDAFVSLPHSAQGTDCQALLWVPRAQLGPKSPAREAHVRRGEGQGTGEVSGTWRVQQVHNGGEMRQEEGR